MLTPKLNWLAPALIGVLTTSSNAQAEVWAITDSAHPLNVPAGVRLIRLDDQLRLEAQLSRSLPTNPTQASLAAQQRLNSPEGARLLAELADAQQGAADAWSIGVTKIPAVVVDRQYVVYGQPDVPAAIKAIEAARGRQ
jgi:integrating conjugative element protein (TIGR03757 family)